MSAHDEELIATAEQREIAALLAECIDLRAKNEKLWDERMAVINGLGIMPSMDKGATFERAVLEAFGNPDFLAGFSAARGRAIEALVRSPRAEWNDLVIAVRAIRYR